MSHEGKSGSSIDLYNELYNSIINSITFYNLDSEFNLVLYANDVL